MGEGFPHIIAGIILLKSYFATNRTTEQIALFPRTQLSFKLFYCILQFKSVVFTLLGWYKRFVKQCALQVKQ